MRGMEEVICLSFLLLANAEVNGKFVSAFTMGNTDVFVRVRKACSEDSFLYFIEAVNSGFIKIGRSVNPERRLEQLSTGSPEQLVILGKWGIRILEPPGSTNPSPLGEGRSL